MAFIFFVSLAAFVLAMPRASWACMTILVGRKASATGEVLVAHNEDAPGRFTMQTHLVQKRRRRSGKKIKFEPDLSELELGETRTNLFWAEAKTYSKKFSDSAFCDFYANGHGVVICSNNCEESKEDSPELLNGGIGYGLRRLVAERSHCAKEALEIACGLVERYGYASSGRSYAFADKDEIFVMQIVHGKHYAIARVPDDEVAVIPNHYTIREPEKKFRGYDELISYAKARGWYKDSDGAFDFARVYQAENSFGLAKNTYRHVKAFEILLDMDLSGLLKTEWQPLPFSIKPAKLVDIETLKKILRAHNEGLHHFDKPIGICNCDTLESTIAQIRHNPDRIILRKALGRPCSSPYVAWYSGINSVPEDYEIRDPENSLLEHFKTKPEDMDYRNNAWYRSMEICAACDILHDESVEAEIQAFEEEVEEKLKVLDPQIQLRLRNEPRIAQAMMEAAVLQCSKDSEQLAATLRAKLKIIIGEALNSVSSEKIFRVRIPAGASKLNASGCLCGPSYVDKGDWSQCCEVSDTGDGYVTLNFKPGEWLKDAVPCFTDLYMVIEEESGTRRAGTVRAKVNA